MGSLTHIDDYGLEIFPVDSDVLSMEHPLAFRVNTLLTYYQNR